MTTSSDSTISSLYLAYFGRPADPAGLAFWSAQLAATGELAPIVQAFATSAESVALFDTRDTSARITQIYEQLYDRAPDAAGLAYWAAAVDRGSVGLGAVAVAILNGAQGSDANLAALRETAVASFTAKVAQAHIDYTGAAALEAARVLTKAVTLHASASDIDTMVSAAANLVQTAHDHPAVLDAIATGTTLQALFDTVRGSADPVDLLQALAGVAKDAAGDPATLESLLRGGGMAQVLKVMPADASLADVVHALASGGLAAAVDVVYPPDDDSAPAFSISFAFKGVTQGAGDLHPTDNVTNVRLPEVDFSYSGALQSDQHLEWSTDGVTWNTGGITIDSGSSTVHISGVDLADGAPEHVDSLLSGLHINTIAGNLDTTVYLRAADAGGATGTTATQQIVYDHHVAQANVAFDTSHTDYDLAGYETTVTNSAAYTVSPTESGTTIDYQVGNSSAWTTTAPALQEGANTFTVRQTDAAGNVATEQVNVTLDTHAPTGTPVLALANDTGTSSTDHLTKDASVTITGLDTHTDTAWDYQVDGGAWLTGGANDGSGTATLTFDSLDDGLHDIVVRQHDAAGNVGTASIPLTVTLDTTAPTVTFTFAGVEGNTDPDHPATTTLATADVTFGYSGTIAAGDLIGWLTGDGAIHADGVTIDTVHHTVTIGAVDLSASDPTVTLALVDAAGNVGAPASQLIDGPYAPTLLAFTPTANGLDVQGATGNAVVKASDGSPVFMQLSDGDAIAGIEGIGAQAAVTTDVFGIQNGGSVTPDPAGHAYTLGTAGADQVFGSGDMWGFGGNDLLSDLTNGGSHLYGGAGNDTLIGGGDDVMSGGAGTDRFALHDSFLQSTSNAAQAGITTITDFEAGVDHLTMVSSLNTQLVVDQTYYTSLANVVAAAELNLGAGSVYQVYAAQLGADTYVFAKGSDETGAFDPAVDQVVKLANFSATTLTDSNISGAAIGKALVGDATYNVVENSYAGSADSTPMHVQGADGGTADTIGGGLGNDVLVGGAGADTIVLNGGIDTLVYRSAADSNLSGLAHDPSSVTYDTVTINYNVSMAQFNFGVDVGGVHTVTQTLDTADLLANIDAVYHDVATSRTDAVLINSGGTSYLVVNNGDDVIDGNDYVIKIVGTGSIASDGAGHVLMSFDTVAPPPPP